MASLTLCVLSLNNQSLVRSLTIQHDTNSMNCNGFLAKPHSHWCGIYYICPEVNQVCKDRKESAAQGVLIDKGGNKWRFIICLVCKRANYGLTYIACSALNNISLVTTLFVSPSYCKDWTLSEHATNSMDVDIFPCEPRSHRGSIHYICSKVDQVCENRKECADWLESVPICPLQSQQLVSRVDLPICGVRGCFTISILSH